MLSFVFTVVLLLLYSLYCSHIKREMRTLLFCMEVGIYFTQAVFVAVQESSGRLLIMLWRRAS